MTSNFIEIFDIKKITSNFIEIFDIKGFMLYIMSRL
jgi:hypothetical protein